jgi:hypothetical protein
MGLNEDGNTGWDRAAAKTKAPVQCSAWFLAARGVSGAGERA